MHILERCLRRTRNTARTTSSAATLGLVLFLGTKASAQTLTIECSGGLDAACTGKFPDAVQRVRMQFTVKRSGTAVQNALVRLRSDSSGTLQPDSVYTDVHGEANVEWFRVAGANSVGIAVDVRHGAEAGVKYVRLTPDAEARRRIVMRKNKGFQQSWFEKSQLPSYVEVELLEETVQQGTTVQTPILDPATCSANRVAFVRRGIAASVSPDTAVGLRYDTGCYAWAYWHLGEGVGDRDLDVRLLPGKGFTGDGRSLVAEAWARPAPKFIAGFAMMHERAYIAYNPASTRVVQIEETLPDGTTRSYETTETTGVPSITDVASRPQTVAVAGVSLAIPLAFLRNWDNLSVTAGVDLARPTDRIFLGTSPLRLILSRWVPVVEGMPFDVHGLMSWYRQPFLLDVESCRGGGTCEQSKRMRWQGYSWMVSADATSLVSELVKKLAP